MVDPGAVRHRRPGADVEILGEVGEPGVRVDLTDRGLHRTDGDRTGEVQAVGAQPLGDSGVDDRAGVVRGEHQVGLVHRADAQGWQDRPARLAGVRRHVGAALGVRRGGPQHFDDLAEVCPGQGPVRLVARVVGELLVVEGGDEVVGGVRQGRTPGLGDGQCGVEGLQRFLADGELLTGIDTVDLLQPEDELIGQRQLPLLEHLPDSLPVVGGDVLGVVPPAVLGEHVVDDDQLAELLHPLGGQEVRQPDRGERGGGHRPGQRLDAGVVLGDGVVRLVEGDVDDDAQGALEPRGEEMVGQVSPVPDIAEDELDVAVGTAPGDGPGVGPVGAGLDRGDAESLGEQGTDLPCPTALGVLRAGLGDDGLPGHVLELEGDRRVLHTRGDDDLGELPGPGTDDFQHHGDVAAAEGRTDRPVVEVGQAGRRHLLERRDLRGDRGEDEGLADPQFGTGGGVCDVLVPGGRGQVVGLEDQRAEFVVPELLAEGEAVGGVIAHLLVAGEQVVEGVSDGDDPVDGHRAPLVDEHGLHDLQRGTFPLHDRGEADQGVDQGGGEGEGQLEPLQVGRLVVLVGVHPVQQDVHHVPVELELGERAGELHLGGVVEGTQQALVRDHRQVAAAELDVVEAALLVLEGLPTCLELPAGLDRGILPGGEVVLAGDEGDHRYGELTLPGLDQQGELLGLVVEQFRGALEHQPEDQLVEEEHHTLVAEGLRVPGDLGETVGQGDPLGVRPVGGEQGLGEGGGQVAPLRLTGRGSPGGPVGRRGPVVGSGGVHPGSTHECTEVDATGDGGGS